MRVLVLDDTPLNLQLLDALLRRVEPCVPVLCASSADGLALALAEPFDLVITDQLMPEPEGLTVVRLLRERYALEELPILLVSSDNERELRHAALETGANDVLTRPLDPIEFRSRVRNMLSIRRGWLRMTDRNAELTAEVHAATHQIRERELELIYRLSHAAEMRDPETGAHLMRMAAYSRIIGEQLGWSDEALDQLHHAAPMHDIGKVGTPDSVLLKPGRLDPVELDVMRQHAELGYRLLAGSSSPMLQLASQIAHSHHEKWDGSGYPGGLAGEAIPQVGRIVAVADVFDALTSARPYKAAWPLEEARAYLVNGKGRHFDPRCVDAFLERWADVLDVQGRYPG